MNILSKKIFFLIMLFGVFISAMAQKKNYFTIEGTIVGVNIGVIHLSYYDLKQWKNDSAFIKNGEYKFYGSFLMPCKAVLTYKNSSQIQNKFEFWIDNGLIKMTSDSLFSHKKVVAGIVNRDDSILANSKRLIIRRYQPLLDTLENLHNGDSIRAFREKIYPYLNEIRKADFNFFTSYPNSIITGFYLMPYLADTPADTLKQIYKRFNSTMRSTPYAIAVKKRIEILERINIGQEAIEFCGTNFGDKSQVCLKNFKGKYILLDFWASWCLPCRQSTPHQIDLFNKYKDRGLAIIGIADDETNPEAWKQAIIKDGTGIWYNILSGQKEDNNKRGIIAVSIIDKYGVGSLPTKILIDKNGMIIGRYNGTEEESALDKKLFDIFNR